MPRPKIPVEDRLEIQELFAYYAWGLNTGDEEQVLSCFTEDASFEHQPQGIFHGHEQIKILLNHLWYDKPGWFIGRQHLANHFILTPRGEQEMHVKAYSTLVQYQVDYKRNFVFGLANWDNVAHQGVRRVAIQVHAHPQVDGRGRAVGGRRPRQDQRAGRPADLKSKPHPPRQAARSGRQAGPHLRFLGFPRKVNSPLALNAVS